jgi:hypothetical protein
MSLHNNLSKYIYKISILLVLLIYLIGSNVNAEDINSPNYDKFQDRLMISVIFIVSIFIFGKILVKFSAKLTRNKQLKHILDLKILEYLLMICTSTISFSIIGWGIITDTYWDRAMLIDVIIICFILFALDTLILRPYKKIKNILSPILENISINYSNIDIYFSVCVLFILIIGYIGRL